MSEFIGDWHSLLVLLLAGFLPNEVWHDRPLARRRS